MRHRSYPGLLRIASMVASFVALLGAPFVRASAQTSAQTSAQASDKPAPTPVTAAPTDHRVGLGDDAPLRYLRCFAGMDVGCFRVVGNIVDVSSAPDRLTARLDSSTLIGPGEKRSEIDPTIALKLLIAYDVSGSMSENGGFEATRFALGRFLQKLPPSLSVALVPFESRRVREGFSGAQFKSASDVTAQLRRLPRPDKGGNTALYQAIYDGLRTLDRQSGASDQSILLVITDGRNDVDHPADEKGLLSGDAGLEQVRAAVAGSKHRVWLLGAGRGVDSVVLSQIAGSTGRSRVVAIEFDLLSLALDAIKDEMTPRRMLVYGVPATAQATLARRSRGFVLPALNDVPRAWRPPLVAMPPFEGIADSALVPPGMREQLSDSGTDMRQRILIGIPLLLVVLVAYLAIPRIVGPPPEDAPASAVPVSARGHTSALRPATEAPPRRPTDITKDGAR